MSPGSSRPGRIRRVMMIQSWLRGQVSTTEGITLGRQRTTSATGLTSSSEPEQAVSERTPRTSVQIDLTPYETWMIETVESGVVYRERVNVIDRGAGDRDRRSRRRGVCTTSKIIKQPDRRSNRSHAGTTTLLMSVSPSVPIHLLSWFVCYQKYCVSEWVKNTSHRNYKLIQSNSVQVYDRQAA